MKTATGISLADKTLCLACLERTKDTCRVKSLAKHTLSFSGTLAPKNPAALIDEFKKALDVLPAPPGKLAFALGGGYYHIQKIPLEVAGEDARRDQIAWEAAQALIGPVEEYNIDFMPAGRIAFWTAVRRCIIDTLQSISEAISEPAMHMTVEPLALFQAGVHNKLWTSGRQAAIHLAPPWSSFVAVEDGMLVAAETVRAIDTVAPASQTQTIRQWIAGDLAGPHRRSSYDRVYLAGQNTDISKAELKELSLSEYPTFAEIHTDELPDSRQIDHPGHYALATGAAIDSLMQTESDAP